MPAALTLPDSSPATRSVWRELTPTDRALFLDQVLTARPGLKPTGDVDYTSDLEPLLEDPNTGFIQTLTGDIVDQNVAPAGSDKLTTTKAVGIPVAVGIVALIILAIGFRSL